VWEAACPQVFSSGGTCTLLPSFLGVHPNFWGCNVPLKSFNCRYNPKMDYAFCLLTLKSYEKWRSPLFGATCNFNDQILPYGGLYLQLKLFRKSRDVMQSVSYIITALLSCNFIIKKYVNRKITSYIYLFIFAKPLWLHVKHLIALTGGGFYV
jgi:hypothetical protein